MGKIIDLFAGPGGWDEALHELDRSADVLGIEYEQNACATRAAAGHNTLQADVSTIDEQDYADDLEGLIASPPCQGFSSAGKGHARNLIPELLASIHARRWTDRADPDPRVWLIVDLGRWLERLRPEWIALEQVPAVLPLWTAYADMLRDLGYSTWTGVLNAADYGVPQTRQRAILMASRTKTAHAPAATHDADPTPSLFGEMAPWVTMAEALGLHGHVGFPRLDDRGDSPDGYRVRDWRSTEEPSFAVTEKARSWILNTGRDWKPGEDRSHAQKIDPEVLPSPTLTAKSGSQWQLTAGNQDRATIRGLDEPAPTVAFGNASGDWIFGRPATTIMGDPRVFQPGGHHTPGAQSENAIKITIAQALILQSFRPDYPVQGTKSRQFEQIGNAIPPLLALRVLRELMDCTSSSPRQDSR